MGGTLAPFLIGISAVITALMPLVLWQLGRIHRLVNSRYHDLLRRVEQLKTTLVASGVAIPAKLPDDDPAAPPRLSAAGDGVQKGQST